MKKDNLEAVRIWNDIPKDIQEKIIENVWCGNEKTTVRITDYNILLDDFGIVLEGKCAECGNSVARVIEST